MCHTQCSFTSISFLTLQSAAKIFHGIYVINKGSCLVGMFCALKGSIIEVYKARWTLYPRAQQALASAEWLISLNQVPGLRRWASQLPPNQLQLHYFCCMKTRPGLCNTF